MELINKQRTPIVIDCTPQGALTFQDLPVNLSKRNNFISLSTSGFCYSNLHSKTINNSKGRKQELHRDIQKLIEMGEDWRISLSKRKEGEE